jgi:hypothetical protein
MHMDNHSTRRHLLIAGTGRSGTSFLVRYLAELGLDTHLGRHGNSPGWDEDANAGLEEMPFLAADIDLPYVIKSPWLYQFIDDLLGDRTFVLDAVVIPVRDFVEAVMSRCIIEQRAIHQKAPWIGRSGRSWEEWAETPGGVIYSLNPIDQGRLLAVGFHHLVQRLVAADIPIIFLGFPKIIEDATYLFEKLRPILPQTVNYSTACCAHQRVADHAKVRVGAEIRAIASPDRSLAPKALGYASQADLDVIVLHRELVRVRTQLAEAHCEASRTDEQNQLASMAAADAARRLNERITTLEVALAEAMAATMQACHDKVEADGARRDEARQCHREIEGLKTELAAIRASRSWRLTYPYRAIGSRLLNAFRRVSQNS